MSLRQPFNNINISTTFSLWHLILKFLKREDHDNVFRVCRQLRVDVAAYYEEICRQDGIRTGIVYDLAQAEEKIIEIPLYYDRLIQELQRSTTIDDQRKIQAIRERFEPEKQELARAAEKIKARENAAIKVFLAQSEAKRREGIAQLQNKSLEEQRKAELEKKEIQEKAQRELEKLTPDSRELLTNRIQLLDNFLKEVTEEKESWGRFFSSRFSRTDILPRSERFEKISFLIFLSLVFLGSGILFLTFSAIDAFLILVLSVALGPILLLIGLADLLTWGVTKLNFAGPERFDVCTLESFSQKALDNIKKIQVAFKDSGDDLVSEIKDANTKTVGDVFSAVSAAKIRLFDQRDKNPHGVAAGAVISSATVGKAFRNVSASRKRFVENFGRSMPGDAISSEQPMRSANGLTYC